MVVINVEVPDRIAKNIKNNNTISMDTLYRYDEDSLFGKAANLAIKDGFSSEKKTQDLFDSIK